MKTPTTTNLKKKLDELFTIVRTHRAEANVHIEVADRAEKEIDKILKLQEPASPKNVVVKKTKTKRRQYALGATTSSVLNYLKKRHHQNLRPAEIAMALSIPTQQVNNSLRALTGREAVVRVREGVYKHAGDPVIKVKPPTGLALSHVN